MSAMGTGERLGASGPLVAGKQLVIDGHQHFWDPADGSCGWMTEDYAAIRRVFSPGATHNVARRGPQERKNILAYLELYRVAKHPPPVIYSAIWPTVLCLRLNAPY